MARPLSLTVSAFVLAALLLLLAVLQYHWAGQLSAAELTRLRASASTRAHELAREFDREITRAYIWFGADAAEVREGDWSSLARDFQHWQKDAPQPRLVRDVFAIAAADSGEAATLTLDAEHGTVPHGPWPAALSAVQQRLVSELRGEREARERLGPMRSIPDTEAPLLIVPVLDPEGAQPPRRILGYVVVLLDLEYIRDVFLPALDKHYFQSDGFDDAIRVYRGREGGEPFYSSSGLDNPPPQPDVTFGLFDVRLDPSNRDLLTGVDAARYSRFRHRLMGDEHGRPVGPRHGDDDGRWRVALWSRGGGLPEVVASARRRNLAISFGILLLLGSSVGLLVTAARRAERLARQQMEFVAGVTHELRTPLAVVRSAGENLADGVVSDPTQVRSYGALVRDEGRRLSEMVEQVLELAQTESGHPLACLPLDVGPLVDGALQQCATDLSAAGIEVERDLAGDLPPVLGDAGALRRALGNLIDNAAKYAGESRFVGIRARAQAGERGSEVAITVEDHGLGIAPEDVPHLFEPFYRGAEARARAIRGSGLGLSLVRRIAEAHGGRVLVERGRERGSAFTLVLPAASEAVA